MPVMNGIDAAREIMRICPEVPLLLCTMYGTDVVIKAAAEVGVKRVISKSDSLGKNLVSTMSFAALSSTEKLRPRTLPQQIRRMPSSACS